MQREEAYFFSHDSDARNDENILALRMRHGWAGYGLYWALIERLRESSDYTCARNYELIAYDLRSESEVIQSIIEDFNLFSFSEDKGRFYSESLNRRMQKKEQISEGRKKAAERRWKREKSKQEDTEYKQDKCNTDANAMQKSTDAMQVDAKERKRKEKKYIPPISPDGDISPSPASDILGDLKPDPPSPPPERFVKFTAWLAKNAPNVAKMKEPITPEQYEKLLADYPKDDVRDILLEMHNWKELPKKKISAYLTARKWLNKRQEEKSESHASKPVKLKL